ncbi:hypothetical protein M0804_002960 [Polistes exclamans]|nr:hypothetical protein M0804_002960 [Polistes exclamans]
MGLASSWKRPQPPTAPTAPPPHVEFIARESLRLARLTRMKTYAAGQDPELRARAIIKDTKDPTDKR